MNVQQLENELWEAADQLRANSKLTAAEYSMPVLGLIFLKFADNKYRQHEPAILQEYQKLKGTRRERTLEEIAIEKCGFYLKDFARYAHLLNARVGHLAWEGTRYRRDGRALYLRGSSSYIDWEGGPALLAVLGRQIDRPRWLAHRLTWYHAPTAWERWARSLARHPKRALIIGGVVIATLTAPVAVVAAGAWTRSLLPDLALPLVPTLEQVTYLELEEDLACPAFIDWTPDAVATPYAVPDPTTPRHLKVALHVSGPAIDPDPAADPHPEADTRPGGPGLVREGASEGGRDRRIREPDLQLEREQGSDRLPVVPLDDERELRRVEPRHDEPLREARPRRRDDLLLAGPRRERDRDDRRRRRFLVERRDAVTRRP